MNLKLIIGASDVLSSEEEKFINGLIKRGQSSFEKERFSFLGSTYKIEAVSVSDMKFRNDSMVLDNNIGENLEITFAKIKSYSGE